MPALSVDESFAKPTSMLYRNRLAMETEEIIRSHPLDGVVLMGGCDKTTPGLVMDALSAGVPMIYLPAGPMLHGYGRMFLRHVTQAEKGCDFDFLEPGFGATAGEPDIF